MNLLMWALAFFLIAVVAGMFGFTGVANVSGSVARLLFGIFVFFLIIALILGLMVVVPLIMASFAANV